MSVSVVSRFPASRVAGVRASVHPNHAIVTVHSHGVHVYNVLDNKCINSWLCGPSLRLETAAVQDRVSKKLFVAGGPRLLLGWEESFSGDLQSAPWRQEFPERIVSLSSHDTMLCVVMKDGAVRLCDPNTSGPGSTSGSGSGSRQRKEHQDLLAGSFACAERGTLVWSSSCRTRLRKWVVVGLFRDDSSGEYILETLSVNQSEKSNQEIKTCAMQVLQFTRSCENSSIADVSHCETSGILAILLSNGSFCTLPVPDSAQAPPLLDTSATTVSNLDLSSSLACHLLNAHYLAVCGINADLEESVHVVDLQYGTEYHRAVLSLERGEELMLVHGCKSHTGELMLITTTHTLYCQALTPPSVSLARVLGRNKTKTTTQLMEDPTAIASTHAGASLDIMGMLESELQLKDATWEQTFKMGWEEQLGRSQEMEGALLKRLLQTSSSEEFVSVLASANSPKSEESASAPPRELELAKDILQRSHQVFSAPSFSALVQHCLKPAIVQRMELALQLLLSTRRVSGTQHPEVVPALLEGDESDAKWPLLISLVEQSSDLPEKQLTLLLRLCLRHLDVSAPPKPNSHRLSSKHWTRKYDSPALFSRTLLNLLLSLPMNELFLQQKLKQLTSAELRTLLHYMAGLLRFHNRCQVDRKMKEYLPSLPQVVDWTSLLVDSHFTELSASEDFEEMLLQLRHLVRQEERICHSMENLEGQLHFLQHPIHVPQTLQPYSIELLPI